jgi:S-DNA-T family DNA segregation ATPase FtsK/SpoIIIE
MKNQNGLPPIGDILDQAVADGRNQAAAREQAAIIEKVLADFDLPAQVRNVHYGPRLTQFSLRPGVQGQVDKIKKLEPDLAVALSGALAQIEEPGPGYPYVRLIVENYGRPNVKLRQVLESPTFSHKEAAIKVGLGLDTFGEPVVIDLAALPHLLIGGATGSGKSMAVNAMISSMLCTYQPHELQLLLVDPLRVELEKYEGLPHLAAPVIGHSRQVFDALSQLMAEIEHRYTTFAQLGVRDIAAYNRQASQKLPYLVVIIDNLLDLMMTAAKDVEQALTRIAQKARGAGIHVVLATVRSNVGTVSGTIKANFPGRIAFRVADRVESQQILDAGGAEKLLGQGDMLYKSPHTSFLQRVQGIYVSEQELQRIIGFWRRRK